MLTFLLGILNLELTFALKHVMMLLILQQQPHPHHPHRVKTYPNMNDIVLIWLILKGIATTLPTGLQHSWKAIAKSPANSVEANYDKTKIKLLTPLMLWRDVFKNCFCFIPMKISHKLCDRMDGTQFWCFLWFPANSLLCIILRYTVYIVSIHE